MNTLEAIHRFKSPCIGIDVSAPGVRIPQTMQGLVHGGILTVDLTTQARGLRWDPEWRWFSFGAVIDRAFIPAEAVTTAIDMATGAILPTTRRVH